MKKKRKRDGSDAGSDVSSGEDLPQFQSYKPIGPLDNLVNDDKEIYIERPEETPISSKARSSSLSEGMAIKTSSMPVISSTDSEKMDVTSSYVPQLPHQGKETFYLFNVGQGNSQLAIYDEGLETPFGVLYDCGSSSQTVNEKILKTRFSNTSFKSFVSLKPSGTNDAPSPDVDDSDDDEVRRSDSSASIGSSISMEAQTVEKKDLKKDHSSHLPNIQDIIKKHNLKRLFVFLSHADKDHINLLQESIPDDLPISLILCGHFFAESDSKKNTQTSSTTEEDKSKTNVQNLFKYIQSKQDIQVILPYHWGDKHYTQIENFIQSGKSLDKKLQNHLVEDKEHTPPSFHGTLRDFLKQALIEKNKTTQNPHLSNMEVNVPIDSSSTFDSDSLDNIYIWNLNKISKDPNNQCPIISLQMPSIKKTFICTGDAHDEVFGDIIQYVPNYKQLISQYVNANDYTVVLMLPHHGSEGNTSFRMIKLFKPHALGIAAGSGGQYEHPRTATIKEYKSYYKTKKSLQRRLKRFWNTFSSQEPYYYLSFGDSATKRHRLDAEKFLKPKKFPLLIVCPNISGNIRIQQEFTAQFHHLFTYGTQDYRVDFKKSLADVIVPSSGDTFTYGNVEYCKETGSTPPIFINNDKSSLIIRVDMKNKKKENIQVYYKGDKL